MTEPISKLTPSDLAALLCARICHDLISPVGALGTALEVLDDDKNADMHDDAMALVRTSAGQAAAKLKYLRLALGAGTSAPGMIGINEIRQLVDGMYGQGKITINWTTEIEGLEKHTARLLLNVIMITQQTIPRGGTLAIRIEITGDAYLLSLSAHGPKARLSDDIVRTLAGKAPEGGFDGRTIQPFYTGMLIRDIKGRIDSSIEGETVNFTVFAPHKSPS